MPSTWRHVNRKDRCPICGKPDWCRISADGQWAICRRLDTGDGHRKVDKGGTEYWVYRLHGNTTHAGLPPMPPSVVTPERATDDVLNEVYGALLQSLSLATQHRAQLSQRGLGEQDITFRRYRSLPHQGRARLAKALVERFGEAMCAHVPGLYVREHDGRRWWSLAGASGLVIPVRNAAGQIIALTVRSDNLDAASRYWPSESEAVTSGKPVLQPGVFQDLLPSGSSSR
jgi:hypothetical protein